eukprot:3253269-Prymnesium_polylepis.1
MVPAVALQHEQLRGLLLSTQRIPLLSGEVVLHSLLHLSHQQALHFHGRGAIVRRDHPTRQLCHVHLSRVRDGVGQTWVKLLKDSTQALHLSCTTLQDLLEYIVDLLLRRFACPNARRADYDGKQLAIWAVDANNGVDQVDLPAARAISKKLPPRACLHDAERGKSLHDYEQLTAHAHAKANTGNLYRLERYEVSRHGHNDSGDARCGCAVDVQLHDRRPHPERPRMCAPLAVGAERGNCAH